MKSATIVASVLIIIAVLIPGGNLPSVGIGGFDKMVHIGMFALWIVAVCYDFSLRSSHYPLVFAVGLVFSLTTELLQLLVEGRSFDWLDMAADAAGLLVGLLICRPVLQWIERRKR